MSTYGGVGWVSAEDADGDFIKRTEYFAKGQLGTYDTSISNFGLLPVGSNGQILTADASSTYGLSWQTPAGEVITAGVPAAQSGSSRLTINDAGPSTTLAVAQTGVVAGTYGSAVSVPVVQFSDTGQALSCINTPINFPVAADQLASVPTRCWGAGTGRNTGVADIVVVGDGASAAGASTACVVGSASRVFTNGSSYGYMVRSTAQNNHFYGRNIGNITMAGTATGNIVVSSNSLLALTSGQNNAVFGTGSTPAITTGSQNNIYGSASCPVLTTGSGNCIYGSGTAQQLTTGSSNSIFGNVAGATLVSGNGNSLFGDLARVSFNVSTNCSAFGYNCVAAQEASAFGANCQASAANSVVCGYQSVCGSPGGNAFGVRVNTGVGQNITVIGNDITNNLANSCLIGNNTVGVEYICRTTGFLRSAKQVSAVGGQVAGDPLQVIASGGGPVLLNLESIRFDNFPTSDRAAAFDLGLDRIYLGSLGDVGTSFGAVVSLEGTVSANSQWRINVLWTAPPSVLNARIAGCSEQTLAAVPTGNCLSVSTIVNVLPGSTDRNYITFTLENLQGGGTFTITNFRAGIFRIN